MIDFLFKKKETDIWAIGITRASTIDFINSPGKREVKWIYPPKKFSMIADPFGVWHKNKLYIFFEALDYRNKIGKIDCMIFNNNLDEIETFTLLKNEHHHSYPFILKDRNYFYMVPETSSSNTTSLYIFKEFPKKIVEVKNIFPKIGLIDSSFIKYKNKWWCFYALKGKNNEDIKCLHVMYSKLITGPWLPHENNPVRTDISSSRPGGLPFLSDGKIILPVQDCSKTYGGRIKLLQINKISNKKFNAEIINSVSPSLLNRKYRDGIHTISSAGPYILFDVKNILKSNYRLLINLEKRFMRLARKLKIRL